MKYLITLLTVSLIFFSSCKKDEVCSYGTLRIKMPTKGEYKTLIKGNNHAAYQLDFIPTDKNNVLIVPNIAYDTTWFVFDGTTHVYGPIQFVINSCDRQEIFQ